MNQIPSTLSKLKTAISSAVLPFWETLTLATIRNASSSSETLPNHLHSPAFLDHHNALGCLDFGKIENDNKFNIIN